MIDFNFIALTIRDWAVNAHRLGGADSYDKTVSLLRQLAADVLTEEADELGEAAVMLAAQAVLTDEPDDEKLSAASKALLDTSEAIRSKAAEFLKASSS